MSVETVATLIFRFSGLFLLLALIPTAVSDAIPVLYYSAKFGSSATTGSQWGFLAAIWPIIGIVLGSLMAACSRSLGRAISRGL